MRKIVKDRRLVIFEAAITAGLVSFPIISLFYASLGLSQEEIALTQVAYTAIVTVLNIPCGWLADRFGRKQANVLGDAICALALMCYSRTRGFWGVVACECMFGVGAAFSQGVDSSLLKHFCDKERRPFRDNYAKMTMLSMLCSLAETLICGPISKLGYRNTIAISAIPYALGAIASAFIHDDSERIAKTEQNILRELAEMARRNIRNRRLCIRMVAYVVAREITHGVIWFFSPLLASFGWSVTAIAAAVTINELCKVLGAAMARKYAGRLRDWQIFLLPIGLVAISCVILAISLTPLTIGLYAGFGLACGWVSATMMPMLKEEVAASEQSTIESAARVASGLLYMISVWLINRAAGVGFRWGFVMVLVIFLPLTLLVLGQMVVREDDKS